MYDVMFRRLNELPTNIKVIIPPDKQVQYLWVFKLDEILAIIVNILQKQLAVEW